MEGATEKLTYNLPAFQGELDPVLRARVEARLAQPWSGRRGRKAAITNSPRRKVVTQTAIGTKGNW